MEVVKAIYERKSVRAYTAELISATSIQKILQAGTRAPSGKNGQPWRFAVVNRDKALLKKIADLTIYGFVKEADCLVLVFMDKAESYHYVKDCQAIGACIENMLLTATETGVGACWIGEILNRGGEVKELLGIGDRYDLMAAVALGCPLGETEKPSGRKPLEECILINK